MHLYIYITYIFISFVILKYIVEFYLSYRNKTHIKKNQDKVPELFSKKIGLADHQKAAKYSVEKINTGMILEIFEYAILLIWTIGGGLEHLDKYIRTFNYSELLTGVIFFISFMLISLVLGLPAKAYSTFYIEEKYGFNKTTLKTFILDIIKGVVLSMVLGIPISFGILSIMKYLGNLWWLYAWIFLTAIQFLIILIYPTLIAPIFNKFSPLEEGETKETIGKLLQKTQFKNRGIFVMDASKRSSHGNAYFTGFGKNKRVVFFDTLIKTLTPNEIKAVLAHELGHFKKKHVLKNLIRSLIFSLIAFAILGFLYNLKPFYLGHGVKTESAHMALILFSMVSSVYTFMLTPIFSWISRKYEFEADRFASEYSDPLDLVSSLIKMYKDNASTLTPDPVYSSFYHSHPPAIIRINFLSKLKKIVK